MGGIEMERKGSKGIMLSLIDMQNWIEGMGDTFTS